ncbi:DUF1330 domain-containing protein [Streptomyces sp. UNOC14_S4]|uniref:DUF1330 domain-containing protein n=1 Tax=Streptomyces sp. UNOC14_S4 TaxID=2872340 RepID=UPI001E52A077|nr:DUF1330 domain-containing protein [Streptomyces sp. UNOC14_S4]MCC3767145.1 DUF1330 domain-containing protein [Streptomyces sp. UNOC14_S4]
MTVYAIAQLSINDRPRYERYVARFLPVLQQYGGRLLAADEQVEVVEGEWAKDKLIMVAFPDRDAFTAWAASPEYVEIAEDRLGATEGPVLLVHGVA